MVTLFILVMVVRTVLDRVSVSGRAPASTTNVPEAGAGSVGG